MSRMNEIALRMSIFYGIFGVLNVPITFILTFLLFIGMVYTPFAIIVYLLLNSLMFFIPFHIINKFTDRIPRKMNVTFLVIFISLYLVLVFILFLN